MVEIVTYSIFDSPMQTLVNPVNLQGIMGNGLAAEFKARYPKMYQEYYFLCRRKEFKLGMLFLWKAENDHWVLNFPTKILWRKPSKLEYIEVGLKKFVNQYEKQGITSISFPMLGTGRGKLKWEDVKKLMLKYLNRINIPVLIHEFKQNKN